MSELKEMPKLGEGQKTYAGIPEAVFVDDVVAFMADPDNDNNADKVLKKLDEQHSKYKFMQFNIASKRRRLKQQIPDLTNSLEMIEILKKQQTDMKTQFLLSEQAYVKTTIPPTKTVYLWLGANVMLEYPLDEAETLLKNNYDAAIINLKCLEHDQDFLRDQITTTEVNMARVFNWDVKRQRRVATTPTTATKAT